MDGVKKFGFSGTREGMTNGQKQNFMKWVADNLDLLRDSEFHMGCCVGADKEAVTFIHRAQLDMKIIGHPAFPEDHKFRAEIECDELKPLRSPIDRNRIIVITVGMMFIAPKFPKNPRSGTWATFAYSHKRKTPVVMISPVMNDQGGWFPQGKTIS